MLTAWPITAITAKQHYADLIGTHSLHVQSFQGHGGDFIKQSGFSPDAYVQMVM
jgi:carnitine O-acetyltransferase